MLRPMHLPLSLIVGILALSRITETQGQFVSSSTNNNPCRPSPCGPNTRCVVAPRGVAVAQCRCMDGYVPDGHTINGCKPQCIRDNECSSDQHCQANKCVKVCGPGRCGINAECEAINNRAVCKCPSGYLGQAEFRCNKIRQDNEARPPAPPLPNDPCEPNPCGLNADCRVRNERAVCTCPRGYQGDPLNNCIRGECIEHTDCPGHLACQRLQCIDPCNIPNICGRNAECKTIDNQPICSCGSNMVGDPFEACRRFDPEELCRQSPSPCGRNTNCKVRRDDTGEYRAECTCIENYIGEPRSGCRPECVSHSECPSQMACSNNRCVNPCVDACGEGAICDVVQGRAKCSCPQYYVGSPYTRCYPECTAHNDCRSHQACFQFQCVDPCKDACGVGAECKVENHTPICSCPKGYTGHPFELCEPFKPEDLCRPNPCGPGADCSPGFDREGNDRPVCTCQRGFFGNPLKLCQRGNCLQNNECSNNRACNGYQCQDPCYYDQRSVCGTGAECNVKNHQPVCSCPKGYEGNPLQACFPRLNIGAGHTL